MSLITVTYNGWDMNREVIPAINEPEVFFRPVAPSYETGLLTDREVQGSLNPTTGAGSVRLESDQWYIPIISWLKNPEDPRNRSRGETEWPAFNSAGGGPISSLFPSFPVGPIYAELGPPPPGSNAVWIDLTNVTPEGALVYSPERN